MSTKLIRTAWTHQAYAYHPYAYHPGFVHHGMGTGGALGSMLLSSLIHGVIYSIIFRLLRHLSLSELILLGVVLIAGVYVWNRDRSARRW